MIDLNKEFYLVDKHYKGVHPSAGGFEIVKADDFNQLDLNDIWCPYCGTKGFILASFNNECEAKVAQGALLATPESHEYMRSLITNFFKSRKSDSMRSEMISQSN